ncbi:MAG: RDD family protein [Planctomycetes bacterium]|nr:RDD family protein [Planctomycetota bacterium]
MDTDSKLLVETPEAVTIERDLAGLASRVAALSIDLMIFGSAAFGLAFVLSKLPDGWDFIILESGILLILALGYFVFLPSMAGATPGKKLLGLRVVFDDGRPANALAHFLRFLILPIELSLPVPAFPVGIVAILLSKDGKRIGDYLAGTVVARDRDHGADAADPFPELTYHSLMIRTVELPAQRVRELTGADLVNLRDYLSRARSLTPDARARIGDALCENLRARLEIGIIQNRDAFLKEVYLCLRDERSKL